MTIEVGGSGGVEEMRMFRKQEVQVMAESSTRIVKFLGMMTRFAVGRKPVKQKPKSSLRKKMYSFPRAAPTNYHKIICLKQKFIPSQFWRPEVLNQGVGRVNSF